MISRPTSSGPHSPSMARSAEVTPTGGTAGTKQPPIPSPNYTIPKSGFHGKEESKQDWSGDPRSGKVVFLSHCMLNQNARIIRAADFPAMVAATMAEAAHTAAGTIN